MLNLNIPTIQVNGRDFYEDELRESCRQLTRQLFHANERPLAEKLRAVRFLEAAHEIRPDLVPKIHIIRRLAGLTGE